MKSLAHCIVVSGLMAVSLVNAQVAPAPATTVVPSAQPVIPTAPAVRSLPPTRWTTAQISQSFEFADSDGNGVLTRAEAQQLTIMPRTFEDMDENKDGVVSRAEYNDSFNR